MAEPSTAGAAGVWGRGMSSSSSGMRIGIGGDTDHQLPRAVTIPCSDEDEPPLVPPLPSGLSLLSPRSLVT